MNGDYEPLPPDQPERSAVSEIKTELQHTIFPLREECVPASVALRHAEELDRLRAECEAEREAAEYAKILNEILFVPQRSALMRIMLRDGVEERILLKLKKYGRM